MSDEKSLIKQFFSDAEKGIITQQNSNSNFDYTNQNLMGQDFSDINSRPEYTIPVTENQRMFRQIIAKKGKGNKGH